MIIQRLGRWGIVRCQSLGAATLFLLRVIFGSVRPGLVIKQIYNSGFLSLSIIVVSAAFVGMVLSLQGYYTLSRFGASEALGQLIALSIVRELGPVVTALLFAGRAGSSIASEIGLMKTTEQLSSLEMMGIDPLRYVIAARFWGGQISLPILAIIFNVVAIYGGYWVGVDWLGVNGSSFWGNMQASVSWQGDILNGVIKSMAFGLVVTWVAVYQGYIAPPTAEGVARATTRTVIYSSLAVLGVDFILTAIMFGGGS
ncbi:putative phospholipid ABC transporter permease protein MlaE [Piscirickettsia salmonis]|uniref:lipid asymmetry maintenance ABC transporter permease subunit MlaE n=1 Tax=Piscirickettsia salmonis TaxID=1238 RepID=UPI0012D86239|nr:lipid asymmetry maintenance ABC transporter permease subunit MlaE [Piscirickettsia salmonis]QGP53590.1 putative phospholipid ABC transporter permease protein MlaE [Piscirickettsia salmonis]